MHEPASERWPYRTLATVCSTRCRRPRLRADSLKTRSWVRVQPDDNIARIPRLKELPVAHRPGTRQGLAGRRCHSRRLSLDASAEARSGGCSATAGANRVARFVNSKHNGRHDADA